MVADEIQALTFDPVQWGPVVEGWLAPIGGIERHVNALAARIEAGEYQALLIRADGQAVGVLVLSVEVEPLGSIIVVNALAARPLRGLDVTKAVLAFLTETGKAVGAVGLRFWTERKGLVRKCEAAGMRAKFVVEGFF